MQSSSVTGQWRDKSTIWLLIILILGAVLRFYHLGYNSFWLDEAGVAYAAGADSLAKMLGVVRSHVLAMPLDYFIVWLVGRLSLQEAALRIPAALWGIGSLYLAYRLYRKFVSPVPALFALLVLALSPLHIQYSQELRFYSSLVFFYLLSTLLLWDALQEPSRKSWTIFLITTIIGIYFHPYVIFSFANGMVWLALRPQMNAQVRAQRTAFLFCAILSLLAFLVGYLTFSASNTFKIPLMVFEDSPVEAIAIGLGWLPFNPGTPGLSWIWGIACVVLEMIGVLTVLKTARRSQLSGIFYSILLQLLAVLGADLLQHYFFAPRQLLMLLPLLCLFAGIGAETAIHNIVHWILPKRSPVIAGIACLVVLASLPAIQTYYRDDKGNTRAISEVVMRNWAPGDTYLIIPAYDGFVYKYYIEDVYQRPDIGNRLYGADWQDLMGLNDQRGNIFLITPARLTPAENQQLQDLGYQPRYRSYPQSRYATTLWWLPKNTLKDQ